MHLSSGGAFGGALTFMSRPLDSVVAIRDTRASERRFYRKLLDIYTTSIYYQPDTELSQAVFETVQNQKHWAAH